MQTVKWVAPLILAAAFSAQAWAQDNFYNGQPYATSGMNNSFGFSMGFSGRSSNRHNLDNQPVILRGVNFKFDSAELTPESSAVLDKVAAHLRRSPALRVEVLGHASSEGSVAYNMDLSVRRASAVREYLVEHGVQVGNMRATGYGELQPVVSNAAEHGRVINRRVELKRL